MGHLLLNKESIEKYFGYLTRLDTNSKKQLIIKLTESIEDDKSSKPGIEKLFGAWEDERTTEEIIQDIRDSKTPNRKIENFE